MAMTIARPTVASAAAAAMTMSAMTDASTLSDVENAPNAMIERLTALSISSIDISIEIAFRRARNPKLPIANRTPDRIR